VTSGYLEVRSWALFFQSHIDSSLPLSIDYQRKGKRKGLGKINKKIKNKKINEFPI